jgi:hypothetical protein
MTKALAGILLLAVLVLTGCGWQGAGVVVEKTHRNSYTYLTLVGKVPVMQRAPESWGYKVRDNKGEIHDVNVNREYWDTHGVGTSFDNREK